MVSREINAAVARPLGASDGTPPDPPDPPNGPLLVVVEGSDRGVTHRLEVGVTTLGRDDASGIRVLANGVSRHHAAITTDEAGSWIRDCGSTNGTHVNGVKVEKCSLEHGDTIAIGEVILRFLERRDDEFISYREELYRLATTDGLTALTNRRYFLERLERELGDARHLGAPITLIVFGVDRFARFNAEFGHVAGDGMLRWIVNDAVRPLLGTGDVFARVGGDRFAVVRPRAILDEAVRLGEAIRSRVADGAFASKAQRLSVTVSVGVGEAVAGELDACGLTECAMNRMFEAKQQGANRVVVRRGSLAARAGD